MGWRAQYSKEDGFLRLYIDQPPTQHSVGLTHLVSSLMLTTVRDGERLPPVELFPGGALETEAFMQAVLDAAYEAGLRPSKPKPQLMPIPPEPPEIALLKAHLTDMRKIVAATMGVNL